ncbi:MAG: two-component sensor histidine kinase [Deltaproteobacteria bacterium]|nr:two-component sensor histidine kinase [Deltaproteobacteria bacterium]
MAIFEKLTPQFWHYRDVATQPYERMFNYRRMWQLAVFLTALVALLPLLVIAFIDYRLSQGAIESEIFLRTTRAVSNVQRNVSFFLKERLSALDFIDHDNSFGSMMNPLRLTEILENLKKGFGGFVDLGVIDSSGLQINYVGPYRLEGKDYSGQAWFAEVKACGVYISDVFMGFRRIPHLVIAVKHDLPNGSYYVLRATLDTEKFNELISEPEIREQGDIFIINHEGTLQTPSKSYGKVLVEIPIPVPKYASRSMVYEWKGPNGKPLIIGYRYIADSPFILMLVQEKDELMRPWYKTRGELIGFLSISIVVIIIVIIGVATYLVNRIYMADQKRIMTLHEVEYSNKMASLGRLAAGVAHEINNPLAIINEKAGLVKDLLTLKTGQKNDRKILSLVESILSSSERCGKITRRLLRFARHTEVTIQEIDLEELVEEVMGFLRKEAEHRGITITVGISKDIPRFESDKGKLQQIFLNIFNNAFTAMDDGGHLDVQANLGEQDNALIMITDDGCGIPKEDLKRIFEPFFSKRTKEGGTGLGLSITYGLVRELGGDIAVESEVGKGTTFRISLPLGIPKKEQENTCEYYW